MDCQLWKMRIWQSLYLSSPHLFVLVDLWYLHYILTQCAIQSSAGLDIVITGLFQTFMLSEPLCRMNNGLALACLFSFSIDLTEPQIPHHYFV